MPDILKASIGDVSSGRRLIDDFDSVSPGFGLGAINVEDDAQLGSEGVAYHWVDAGAGEVFLGAGFRTQEGDGEPLPPAYRRLPAPKLVGERAPDAHCGP